MRCFFCNTLILVEGIEDVAYISTYLILTGKMIDFRRYGCHIVPVGGKSEIIKPLAMAKLLNIPAYVVCDADTEKEQIEGEEKRKSEVSKHKKDNKSILGILNYEKSNEWPDEIIKEDNLTMWNTNLTTIINNELGAKWQKYSEDSYAYYGNPGGMKKNPLSIARALKSAWAENVKSKTLIELANNIISFAKK